MELSKCVERNGEQMSGEENNEKEHAEIFRKLDEGRDRLDREKEIRAELEKTVLALSKDVASLVEKIQFYMEADQKRDHHSTPCPNSERLQGIVERVAKSLEDHLQDHKDEAKATIEIQRSKENDWRDTGFKILQAVIILFVLGFMGLVTYKLFGWNPNDPTSLQHHNQVEEHKVK